MSIGDQIRQSRIKQGLTQTELGRRAKVSRPTIARVERGDQPSMRTVAKLAEALGLKVEMQVGKKT